MISILNDKTFGYSEWGHNGKTIRINYVGTGYSVFSNKYNLIVSMEYGLKEFNATVYSQDGVMVAKIAPNNEDVAYQYISSHPSSKSEIAIVGTYDNTVDNFQDWYFEVDLDTFKVGGRLCRAY